MPVQHLNGLVTVNTRHFHYRKSFLKQPGRRFMPEVMEP